MNMESLKDKWLEAMITGPEPGTWRRPFTFGRKSTIKNGVKKARRMP
jgi:hypothetical protein